MATHIYKPGAKVKCMSSFEYDGCFIPLGTYEVVAISKTSVDKIEHIGIASYKALESWGDLNGKVPPCCGLWISVKVMMNHFELDRIGRKVVIKDKFVFKRRNLKGKVCKIVGILPSSKIMFVELQEHIDGCSADGLGKAGHCILIPQKHLEKAE